MTKETVSIYADMLADLPFEPTKQALRELLMVSDRWPSIAAIRRKVAHDMGSLAPDKAQAWAEVRQQITAEGAQGSPRWSHPAVAEAVTSFGWWDLCMSENQEASRAQFWRVYDEISKRFDERAITNPMLNLAAITATDNALALEG